MAQRVKVSPDLIGGDVDEGYGKVADAFRRNMASGKEVGAAVAVYREGRKVVDLWGGFRNGITQLPWEQDTLVNVFSTTKGVASLAVAVAASQGLISYDAKVADYWPEFAQADKKAITVRQLLAHQAGLPAIRPQLTLDELADASRISAKLAAQVPAWRPGTRHGYHAIVAALAFVSQSTAFSTNRQRGSSWPSSSAGVPAEPFSLRFRRAEPGSRWPRPTAHVC
jgi:CubicO group peptidase (beta-lactamase class C family)